MEKFDNICVLILNSVNKLSLSNDNPFFNSELILSVKLVLSFLSKEIVTVENYIFLGMIIELLNDNYSLCLDFDWNTIDYTLEKLDPDLIYKKLCKTIIKIDDLLEKLDKKSDDYTKINSYQYIIYEMEKIEQPHFKLKCKQMIISTNILNKFYSEYPQLHAINPNKDIIIVNM